MSENEIFFTRKDPIHKKTYCFVEKTFTSLFKIENS